MAHKQVHEEYRAMIRLIRRVMYPMFGAQRTNREGQTVPDYDRIERAGGLMQAHEIIVRRYIQIIDNEERERTDKELDLICVFTEADIIREVEKELKEERERGKA